MHLDKRSISVNVSLHPTWLLCSKTWLGTLRGQQHLANNDESAFQRWEKQIHTNTIQCLNAPYKPQTILAVAPGVYSTFRLSKAPRPNSENCGVSFAMLHMLTLLCITSKILFHGTTRLPRQHLPRRLRLASAKRRWGSFSKLPTPAGVAKFPLSAPTAAPTQPAPGPAATLARPAPEQPQSCGLGRAKCNNKSEIWRLGTELR